MSLRVVVADDSMSMRKMISRVLSMTGLSIQSVVEVANGKEALDVLGSGEVDLLLLDVNMPVMNGVECLRRMRESSELTDLPTVVVSSDSSRARRNDMAAMGAAFVQKPFTAEVLADAVISALGGIRGH
ncbi:MAG: response regulator [Sandaracinaceae bacterium]